MSGASRGLSALCALAVLLLVAGCRTAAPPATALVPLVVGGDLDNRPFAWVDDRGRPRGRDVEMMTELGRRLGREVVWQRLPFEQLLEAAEHGRVEVVCATLGHTPERQERVDFTRPYFETTLDVVVRRGRCEPAALADLAGRRVGAGPGTTAERALRELLPEALAVTANPEGRDGAARLADGELDALVLDGPSAVALVSRHRTRLMRLPAALAHESYALVLPRGRAQLREALNAALLATTAEGLRDRWNARHDLHEHRREATAAPPR